ncbi:hypothetical protein EMIHUDRAFT_107477 [Emiliania huxleyi CCMP1516]|uniref:Uncharacterized protein n=2 Tax=Emiliania huxleyi TaxID=2903 RepID=A0A0D3I192_EMIH1|nr:hypothetical protein EMIHUDRAFT_107477 [Emiliania huxleyi CCMP1516]EOD05027.1 hypothetical protein EMIHUDRAFT_107477 [Emiliania huxleyi CCMP1516]|eukprot:XP_005757456.1 hypothetical protein EMIHUDRAFT_107477 [Emiliania huxleyi CCMP1516]
MSGLVLILLAIACGASTAASGKGARGAASSATVCLAVATVCLTGVAAASVGFFASAFSWLAMVPPKVAAAVATLVVVGKADGSVTAWGYSSFGGSGAPTDTGYTALYSTCCAFAAVKADGSVTAWGDSSSGGSGAPTDTGYTALYSTGNAFAALKADGSVTAWGYSSFGGSGAPTDTGYTAIYSTERAFAAVKADGAVTAWGYSSSGGSGAPTDTGYTALYSTCCAFAAVKADGSVTAWGSSSSGGSGAPTDTGYTAIYSTWRAFAAVKADGSVTAWGSSSYGGSGAPTDTGYTAIYSNSGGGGAFAAVKADGSVTAWGSFSNGGRGAPTNTGKPPLYSRGDAFAAFKGERFKVLDEVDQLRDTDKDPDVSQLFYKLLRTRNGTPYYWMRTHLPDVIVPVLNTVVLPRLRTSFEILARANGTPTEELDRAWEEVQLSVAKGGSNIGGHADVVDACFVAAFLAVWPSLRDRPAYRGHALAAGGAPPLVQPPLLVHFNKYYNSLRDRCIKLCPPDRPSKILLVQVGTLSVDQKKNSQSSTLTPEFAA